MAVLNNDDYSFYDMYNVGIQIEIDLLKVRNLQEQPLCLIAVTFRVLQRL